MKKKILNLSKSIVMRLIRLLNYAPFLENNVFAIISYHSFTRGENKYSISVSEFKKQILKLKEESKIVSLEEFISLNKENKSYNSTVAITIDDGYKDVLSIVPFISKNKIPVAIFVLSDPKNANRSELDHKGEILSYKQIKRLKSLGWTIGCHSATHANLTKLNASDLKKEIAESKKTLEKKLGFKIKYFAYPKGEYNKRVVNAVKKAGYKAAFTTNAKKMRVEENPLTHPRVVITDERDLSDFPTFLSNFVLNLRSLTTGFSFKYVK